MATVGVKWLIKTFLFNRWKTAAPIDSVILVQCLYLIIYVRSCMELWSARGLFPGHIFQINAKEQHHDDDWHFGTHGLLWL